jgi:4-amino-4-deoxy-L-arabinose transferase-like glycosyltransferase
MLMQIEVAWTESLVVGLLFGAAALALREDVDDGRERLAAGILLGLALATKQHVALLLPVVVLTIGLRVAVIGVVTGIVATVPWLLANPRLFWRDTVTDYLHFAPRSDALTMWLHEPPPLRPLLVPMALLAAYALTWLCCRGVPHRFFLGAAVVLGGFDLTNKQTFLNQWILVTWLLIGAVALEFDLAQPASAPVTFERSGLARGRRG